MNTQIQDKIYKHFDSGIEVSYGEGEIITFSNQDPKGVSLLIDGIVEQYDITPEGNKITVNIFKPSAFFPMSWAINKTPNAYFYAALTDVKLKNADADKTVEFLRANPDVTFDLLSRVYKGTDVILKRLSLATSGIAANRLIFELLIEAYRFGVESGEGVRVVNIKHNNLAARSGLARETVSRELHKLERSGSLILSKKGITVYTKKLEKLLDIDV